MGGRFDKKVIVPYERKRKYRERNAQSRRGGSIHHFHKSDMKFLSDSTSERIMLAVNAHPNNTNINVRFLMPGPWSDEYCDYHYQWQSWNREERIYNPHDKKPTHSK